MSADSMTKVYFDEVGEYNIDRVEMLLAGIPGGIYRAVGSSIKRAAQHGLTIGMRIVADEYAISSGELKKNTTNINTISKDGSYSVTFGYRGYAIPIIKYDTHIAADGRVETRVLRSNSRQLLDHAFVSRVGTHTGIFERETDARFPIKEIFGPAATQAFYAREKTVDQMDEAVRQSYENRIEHEITRVLNGWG